MASRKIALVASGSIRDYRLIGSLVRTYNACVAVDGGLIHCKAMGIQPSLIIGDFDSIDPSILKDYPAVPLARFPKEKDESDMELAIKKVNGPDVDAIGLFGAWGDRVDHSLANLYLLQRFPGKLLMETERETIRILTGNQRVLSSPGQTVSLLPLGQPARGVTTQGLKWDVANATFDASFLSLSNVSLGEDFAISIGSGCLLCFQERVLFNPGG